MPPPTRNVPRTWSPRSTRLLVCPARLSGRIASLGRITLYHPATGGPASDNLAIARRSLYAQTARWDRSSFATLFDAANPDAFDEKRNVSTVAPQSLFLLNNGFTLGHARQLAERLIRDVPNDTPNAETSRIQHAYRLLFSRLPSEEELAIARQLVGPAGADAGWSDLAHVLLCSNEFIYID